MTEQKKQSALKLCDVMILDIESDIKAIDGKPFDGRTIAKILGGQYAVIHALCNMVKSILTTIQTDETK